MCEYVTNFFSFGIFWKIFDDDAAEVESGDDMLDVEPGGAGDEASSGD